MLPLQFLPQEQALSIIKVLIIDTSEASKTILNTVFRNLIMSNGHLEIIKLLMQDERVDPSSDDNWAITYASQNGHLEIVKILMQDKRVDPSANNNWPITYASQNGRLEIVKILMQDKRVDPSAENNLAIKRASLKGHLEIVTILMQDKRVDPSAENNQAIKWASCNGHLEIVKILMQDKRVDPSAEDNLAIRYASQNGYLETVKILIPRIDLGKITDNKILNLAKEINENNNEKTIFERLNTEIDVLKTQIEELNRKKANAKSKPAAKKGAANKKKELSSSSSDDSSDDVPKKGKKVVKGSKTTANAPKISQSLYQQFIAKEIRRQRDEKPGRKNNDYMVLAAAEWEKYKEENGIVSGGGSKEHSIVSRGSKEDVLKEIIKTMKEYNVHKICIDDSNITLKLVI